MTRTSSTKVQWCVQYRKTRSSRWFNSGLFETRKGAREKAVYLREGRWSNGRLLPNTGFGLGNTRVVRYVKPSKVGVAK